MKDFKIFFDENFIWKKCGFISIFDHWLTDYEANNCGILNYEISVQSQSDLSYLSGESKFINFYKSLSDTVICKLGDNLKILETDSNEFKSILISSLREDSLKFLDVFYPKLEIRFKGGFDRTDQFFLVDEKNIGLIRENVQINQLFILNYEDYNNLN